MTTSFIIPAHNEERHLPATIAAIHEAARAVGLEYEIIVADDASTDRTPQIAATMGARTVRHERRQISATRNLGARAALGEVLFFVDADTVVNADAVREAMGLLAAGAIGGGGSVRFDGRMPLIGHVLLPAFNLLFRVLRLCGGCFVFCTRGAYTASGGWDEAFFAGEEVWFARALKRQGRFRLVRSPVVTSGRKLRTNGMGEILGVLTRGTLSTLFGGARFMKSREGLALWYAPRKEDPDGPAAP